MTAGRKVRLFIYTVPLALSFLGLEVAYFLDLTFCVSATYLSAFFTCFAFHYEMDEQLTTIKTLVALLIFTVPLNYKDYTIYALVRLSFTSINLKTQERDAQFRFFPSSFFAFVFQRFFLLF